MATYAYPIGFLIWVPAKITSSILLPRSCFALCSPSTQRTASATLLFPLPFGPTIAVIPSWNLNTILFANDLNPCTSILFKYILFPLLYSKLLPASNCSKDWYAAFCSADFLVLPTPCMSGVSFIYACTVNFLLWSGPSSDTGS